MFGYDAGYPANISGNTVNVFFGSDKKTFDLGGSELATVTGRLNSAAALLAIQSFPVEAETAMMTLFLFEPGKHRLQEIAEVQGVKYIDDSKATNTGAVNRGLEQVGGTVILIAGGREKGDDFCQLRNSVRKYVKKLILIGEAAEKISSVLGDLVPVVYAQTMDEAVELAALAANKGDRVLLSPACASFDMFDNYIHRGEAFAKAVNNIKIKTIAEVLG